MPVTKDQAHMLAALAVACRPHGAPTWDAPGVVAAIGKVANLSLADVAMACIRAASDKTALTPAVIAATSSIHWAEKVTPQMTPRNPRPHEACDVCGKGDVGHPQDHPWQRRANDAATPPTEWAQAREQMRGTL